MKKFSEIHEKIMEGKSGEFTGSNKEYEELDKILKTKIKKELSVYMNFEDKKLLWSVKDDAKKLAKTYDNILDDIEGVARGNLAINHSNFRNR